MNTGQRGGQARSQRRTTAQISDFWRAKPSFKLETDEEDGEAKAEAGTCQI